MKAVRIHAYRELPTVDDIDEPAIAAVCVREDVAILHRDADFDRLASCSALRVHPVPSA